MSIPAPSIIKDPLQNQNNKNIYEELQRLAGQQIDISDTGVAADTEFSVAHGLGRVPQNVEVLVKEGQTDAYISIRPGPTAWTSTLIYLDCSEANAALRLRVT